MNDRAKKLILCCASLMLMCCALSGCALTVGPRAETRYVITHPGRPLLVLENRKIKGRVLDGSGDAVEQDVGGWVMMPPSHWEVVKKALENAPQPAQGK